MTIIESIRLNISHSILPPHACCLLQAWKADDNKCQKKCFKNFKIEKIRIILHVVHSMLIIDSHF